MALVSSANVRCPLTCSRTGAVPDDKFHGVPITASAPGVDNICLQRGDGEHPGAEQPRSVGAEDVLMTRPEGEHPEGTPVGSLRTLLPAAHLVSTRLSRSSVCVCV